MMSLKQAYRVEAKALRRWKRSLRRDFRFANNYWHDWAYTRRVKLDVENRYIDAGKIQFVEMPF